MTREEIVTPAPVAEEAVHATSIGLATVPTIRRLAELQPVRLALMHGSSFVGNAAAQLTKLAEADCSKSSSDAFLRLAEWHLGTRIHVYQMPF